MSSETRLSVKKTYKLFIGGQFPRTESGRSFHFESKDRSFQTNLCLASRKDFRNAVKAARGAFKGWSEKATPMLRGQILYRMAEILEDRRVHFTEELSFEGLSQKEATSQVDLAIDRLIHYAGWADKYQQIFSSVNPVQTPYFNFSALEPMGVITAMAATETKESSLLELVSAMAPVIVGGNTLVYLASKKTPLTAISFAEVLQASDLPAGVVNILTGDETELLTHIAGHMDVNAVLYLGSEGESLNNLKLLAVQNLKRVVHEETPDWKNPNTESPYWIQNFQEVKTTWHPIGQ